MSVKKNSVVQKGGKHKKMREFLMNHFVTHSGSILLCLCIIIGAA